MLQYKMFTCPFLNRQFGQIKKLKIRFSKKYSFRLEPKSALSLCWKGQVITTV